MSSKQTFVVSTIASGVLYMMAGLIFLVAFQNNPSIPSFVLMWLVGGFLYLLGGLVLYIVYG
jgi:hypothetical protein